ncbi:MAG: saccharopine dehydrogenase C-terminal domain-containing protein [Ginsengibacter sp.]
MKKIAVLGAGMVGRAIATDLSTAADVTSIDISDDSLQKISAGSPGIKTLNKDLTDYSKYGDLLQPYDFVVTAVPGFMGYKTLEAVIKSKKNLVDISFFPEDAFKLDALAKENNITAIVDCGVAPGMSNLVLGYYNERMIVESFECMVGGLPKKRTQPFEYKAPFSPVDVIEEYTRPARLIENGIVVTRPALSDADLLEFEKIGTLESFNTDGLRSLLFTMSHIPDMKEKTLRYPGHIHLMKSLIKGGFFGTEKINVKGNLVLPLEFSSSILFDQWKLGAEEEEFTIMKITIRGKAKSELEKQPGKTIVYDLYDEYDNTTKTSSMARTTGYTCAAAIHLLLNNMVKTTGVIPPEIIGKDENCFRFILNYLEQRNVIYKVTES